MLEVVVVVVLGALGGALLTVYRWRLEDARHERDVARLTALHEHERERTAARVQYLEFQLANHVAHVLKLPPPAPPAGNGPKPEPLPDVMLKFLEAIEGDEERGEYEGSFRAQLALGIDPHRIVSEALRG